eukprot:552050_1
MGFMPAELDSTNIIVTTILFGIAMIVSTLILIHTVYSLYCYKSLPNISNLATSSNSKSSSTSPTKTDDLHTTEDMNNCIKHTTAISIFFFLFPVIVIFIRMAISIVYGYYFIYAEYGDYMTIPMLSCYLIGRWTMLLTFILRLDYTFRDTVYQYKPCAIRTLYIMLFISLVYTLVISTLFMPGSDDNLLMVKIRSYMTICVVIYEFIFINMLMILFIRKLFDLFVRTVTINKTRNIEIELEVASSSSSITVSPAPSNAIDAVSQDLLFVTIKYALLVTVSVISTQILLGLAINKYDFYVVVFSGIDAFVNGSSLYLLNKFAKKMYMKVCKLPHLVCRKCCICVAYSFVKN